MNKYLLVFLLVPAFAATSLAQGQTNARAQAYYHFSKGRLLDDQGQTNQAIDEFKKALELDPNNSLIYSEMAESYLRNNKAGEAVANANKALQLDKDNIEAHKLLTTVYLQAIGRANAQQPPSIELINNAIHEFEEIVRIDPTERQSFVMLARLYSIKGDRDKATEIYKEILRTEPGSEEAVTSLAKLYMDAGDQKDAINLLEQFVMQHPDSDTALQTLGEAYTDLQEFAKAADAYKRAAQLDPDDIEIKKAEAEAMFRAEKIDEATKLYQDLAKAAPDDGLSLLRLGQIYRSQGKYEQARQNLQKAAQAFPDNVEIQFNIVMVDRDEGHLEDALKRANDILKKTEKSNGRYNETEKQNRRIFLINQGMINQTLGNYDAAVKTFQEVKNLTNEKDGRIDALIIETYRMSRNLDKALQYSDQSLADNPGNRQLQIVHADLIAEKGKVDDGIKALQQLQKGNDEDLDVLSSMVSVYQRAKKYDQAQNVLNTAIQRFPNEEQVYFLQGSLDEKQKKYPEAEKAFRKALEIQKDDPAVMNYLGFMFADRGVRLDEAQSLVEKAVKAEPSNGAYLDSLGWVYFKQNKMDLAEEYLKKAIIFVNTDSSIHDHMGDLYFKTKRYDDARNEWNKSIQLSTEQDEIDKVKKKLDELKTTRAAKK
ncbi:MAG TPA: tetratricopeptide repeat protein [Terriglobia bacterium]|nr:tetratricopeptide repeat protein [Terriglobia bacterium]